MEISKALLRKSVNFFTREYFPRVFESSISLREDTQVRGIHTKLKKSLLRRKSALIGISVLDFASFSNGKKKKV